MCVVIFVCICRAVTPPEFFKQPTSCLNMARDLAESASQWCARPNTESELKFQAASALAKLPSPMSVAEWDSCDLMSLVSDAFCSNYPLGKLTIPDALDIPQGLMTGQIEGQSRSNESSSSALSALEDRLPGSPAPGEVVQTRALPRMPHVSLQLCMKSPTMSLLLLELLLKLGRAIVYRSMPDCPLPFAA